MNTMYFLIFWHQECKCCTHLHPFQVARKESYGVQYRPPSSMHRCVQHMKTIRCWCTFMLLLDFVIVDANVANTHPRVNCLKSKVQCQSYLLLIWFTEDSLQRLYQRTFPPTGIGVLIPQPSQCVCFLGAFKEEEGKKIAGRGIEEGVIWNCLLNIIPPANVAWPFHGTQSGKRQVSLEAETHPRPLQHTFLI